MNSYILPFFAALAVFALGFLALDYVLMSVQGLDLFFSK